MDGLEGIAKLRKIKNGDKLKKEDLITSLLKSESSNAESNYMKHLNNNTNDDDNYVDNNANDDDTYDGKIKLVILELSLVY